MSYDIIQENVPPIKKRMGDFLISSYNNSTILLGRDRITNVETGYGTTATENKGVGAASIHMVVGRKTNDLSFNDDRSSFYMSAMNDPDTNADINFGDNQKKVSAICMKADCTRIVSRKDFKISVGNSYIIINNDKIELHGNVVAGQNQSERTIKADSFAAFWSTITIATPSGPSSPPPPIPDYCFTKSVKVS